MKPRLRCAIYTRKSSDEGLDQSFNSLDAQREACEAFIKSQKHEGWQLIPTHYDDGGYSGGTMERPALTRLLDDIDAGQVQVVVVYKVDRLTRALTDFAKMIEHFDASGTSFIAVTQQFNTTTSMGRLTLNVLLSFAQFESEVTGERIRDKIAASKQKGLWMGGYVPLGYDAKDRTLVINPKEAETVRTIFKQYLELGAVRPLKTHLDEVGIVSKVRVNAAGHKTGGQSIARGALYTLLKNHHYIGQIAHKGTHYEGQHAPIIDAHTWDAVQRKLEDNRNTHAHALRAQSPNLLAGRLFDDKGNAMSPSHAVKRGKRYRYYTSQAVVQLRPETGGSITRLPADDIERIVIQDLLQALTARITEHTLLGPDAPIAQRLALTEHATALAGTLPDNRATLHALIQKVTAGQNGVRVDIATAALANVLGVDPPVADTPHTIKRSIRVRLRRCRGEAKLITGHDRDTDTSPPRTSLLKALARAHDWNQRLIRGEAPSIRQLADEAGVTEGYVRRLLPLAGLAPDITETILDGSAPSTLKLDTLMHELPLDWAEQRRKLSG